MGKDAGDAMSTDARIEAKVLRVLRSAKTDDQAAVALRFANLAKRRIGVFQRETDEAYDDAHMLYIMGPFNRRRTAP